LIQKNTKVRGKSAEEMYEEIYSKDYPRHISKEHLEKIRNKFKARLDSR